MNMEIWKEAVQFLFWEYLFRIFGVVSLQCTPYKDLYLHIFLIIHISISISFPFWMHQCANLFITLSTVLFAVRCPPFNGL
jgi:hypothetical protein